MNELESKLEKAAQQLDSYFQKGIEMKSLYETIEKLGQDGLKKAFPTLSPEQQQLLLEVLSKGKQAISMDDKMPEGGTRIRQIESEKVIAKEQDSMDEELVKEEAAEHKHQGDSSPEGFEGQKIEDPEEKEKGKQDKKPGTDPVKKAEEMYEMPKKEAEEEHERLVDVLESPSHEDDEEEAEKQKKELKEIKKAQGMGAGTRGGSIVGYTSTGKPIYESSQDATKPQSEKIESEKNSDAKKRQLRIKDASPKDIKEKIDQKDEESRKESGKMEKHVPGISDEKYDSCVEQVKAKEGEKVNAYAVCTSSLKKSEEMEEKEEPKKDEQKEEKPEDKKDGEKEGQEQKSEQYSDDILSKMIQGMKARGLTRAQAMEKFYENGYSMDKMYKMWEGIGSEPEVQMESKEEKPEEKKDEQKEEPKKEESDQKSFDMKKSEPLLFSEESISEKPPLAIQADQKGMLDTPLVIKPERKEMEAPMTGKPPANADGKEGEELCKDCGKGKKDCVCKEREEKKQEVKIMQKSVKWNPKNVLIASTRRGQNAHYDVSELIEKGEKQIDELKKSSSYYQDPYQEPMAKSEAGTPKAENINDMIEKGKDMNQTTVEAIVRLKKGGEPKFTTKSFSEADLIKSLTPNEFKAASESLKKKI